MWNPYVSSTLRSLLLSASVALLCVPTLLAVEAPALGDYHQHLLSPMVAKLTDKPKAFAARDLIVLMDAAGIRRSVVLSLAYQLGNPHRPAVADEYEKVKAENDWTAEQARQFPERLLAMCAVDPIRDYAVAEVERCSKDAQLKWGLKLHFGNSDVNVDDPKQLEELKQVFQAADRHEMAIVVHMHANVNFHRPYGRRQAEIFLNQLIPAAPHSTIQIAHLTGSGGFADPATKEALAVFIHAIARRDPRMRHVYFDISGIAGLGDWERRKEEIATAIRQIGCGRILFGSDGAWTDFTPAKALAAFRELPLREQERQTILQNVPPYLHAFLNAGAKPSSRRARP